MQQQNKKIDRNFTICEICLMYSDKIGTKPKGWNGLNQKASHENSDQHQKALNKKLLLAKINSTLESNPNFSLSSKFLFKKHLIILIIYLIIILFYRRETRVQSVSKIIHRKKRN